LQSLQILFQNLRFKNMPLKFTIEFADHMRGLILPEYRQGTSGNKGWNENDKGKEYLCSGNG